MFLELARRGDDLSKRREEPTPANIVKIGEDVGLDSALLFRVLILSLILMFPFRWNISQQGKNMKKFLCVLLFVFCLGICFAGLPSVVGASPLDTIPPPITDFFIPVNQTSVEPIRNPGDFIGQVFAPNPEDRQPRPDAQPITGVTLTIASGPRTGESVTTTPSGYYRFQNVTEDELHLRVEKEHFEPKEVKVHRSRPTILANGDVPNYTRDPQQHPGNILIGHRWPDEVRFILEETPVVHDLLYVEDGRLPKGTDLGGFYSRGIVVMYSYQYADWKDVAGLLGTFAHEIAHAHQHATVSVDGSASIRGWHDTPEGRAYEEARRKDWEQVGKSPLDNTYGIGRGVAVALEETAAETCAHYWSVDRWGGRTAYGLLEVEAPNRYKWAEKWVPTTIAPILPPPKPITIVPIPPPPKFVSIPDQNLAAAVREVLGLDRNARIPERAIQRLTQLELRENQISNLRPLTNFTQLTWLTIRDNPISDFTPLANLNQLVGLKIVNSNFSDTTLLADMAKLTDLTLRSNKIDDITALANLTELKRLYLPHNQISDVTPLAGLANLETLHLQDNSIRDVSPLIGLTKLTELRIEDNPIRDKSPLRTLKERNPNLKLPYIEIPPLSPVVLVEASERPPLYWVSETTGTLHHLIGDKVENLVPSVRNATGLAVDITNSKVYWTEKTSDRTGKIRRANLDGSNPQLVKDLTSAPLYIAVNVSGGKLYLINAWNKIQQMNLDGSGFQPNLITGLQIPKGFAVDAEGGKMYWNEQTGQRTGKMSRANLDGSGVEVIKTLTSVPQGIALDAAGSKVYITNTYGKIQRMNLDGSNYQPNLITGLTEPLNVAVDAVDGKVYWMERGSLRRANPNGENVVDVVTGVGTSASLILATMPMDVGAPAAPTAVASLSRKNALLANYPNPCNPETWMPYQLAKPANVSISIYTADGQLIRMLALGYQPAGVYQSRSRAAYWDGRNILGERVASGLYFYTLTAGDFTATRKMLIRK